MKKSKPIGDDLRHFKFASGIKQPACKMAYLAIKFGGGYGTKRTVQKLVDGQWL